MMMAQLLFKNKPTIPPAEELQSAFEKRIGCKCENPPEKKEKVIMFPVPKYKSVFKDKPEGVPPLVSFMTSEFTPKLDEIARSQFWDVRDGNKIIDECKYSVLVNAMLSDALEYKEQAELLLAEVGAALDCYKDCEAVFTVQSGKLTYPESFYECEKYDLSSRFIRLFVNARLFNIEGTDEKIVDTLGLYVFGAADVQLHFKGMDPNIAVTYAYNIASYQFDNNFPVKSGETIDSINEDGKIVWEPQWRTQYEKSLIQPERTVLDINCGKYAAGTRE